MPDRLRPGGGVTLSAGDYLRLTECIRRYVPNANWRKSEDKDEVFLLTLGMMSHNDGTFTVVAG